MFREVRTNPFILRCRVHAAGYTWAKGKHDEKPHLVPRKETGLGIRLKEVPEGLFRQFAELEPTKSAIEIFSREYGGNLFSRQEFVNIISDLVVREDQTATWGASLDAWQGAIEEMKAFVELWDSIRNRSIAKLGKIIDWSDNGVGYRIAGRYVNIAASDALLTCPLRRFVHKDVLLPAQYALQIEINRKLEDPRTVTVPRLAWTPDNYQRLIFMPSNLLAALWLQFAQAVTEELQLRACEVCGRYFQVGPGANRADRQTCSDKCRQQKKRKPKQPKPKQR
jgi:hypothetical protein